jgi:hypothetical protein
MDRYEAKFLKSSRVVPLPPGDGAPPPLSAFKAYPAGPGHRFFTDGTFQRRSETPVRSRATIYDLGHAQIEAVLRPIHDWLEVEPLTAAALADAVKARLDAPPLTDEEMADRVERNQDRSCRRSRSKVRRLVKFKRLDSMLTLTYQDVQADRQLAQRHLTAFVRRVRKFIPDFEYVAVDELQKRGAYHWHLAVRKLQAGFWVRGVYVHSWRLFRAIWRSVIKGGGNIDVQAAGKPGRGVHKLAGYLTKYISKGFLTSKKNQNRYQTSGHDVPDAVVVDFPCVGQAAVAAVHMLLIPEWAAGRVYTSPPLDSGGYFLSFTPDS